MQEPDGCSLDGKGSSGFALDIMQLHFLKATPKIQKQFVIWPEYPLRNKS
jgi:hypothetical protein